VKTIRYLALFTILSGALLAGLGSRAAERAQEWPHYGHDTGDTRFSPLKQITSANVAGLQKVWTFHMRPVSMDIPASNASPGGTRQGSPRAFLGSEATPLVIDGKMVVATPYGRLVALDATTGAQVWAFDLPGNDVPAARGVEYWPGDGGRIVMTTRRGKLMEISLETGALVQAFGDGGILDTKTPDVMNGFSNAPYGFSAPPAVIGDVIVTGSRVQENPTQGPSGDVRGWDARTGKALWTFHTIARPGEPGHETWEGDSWLHRSGVNVWNVPIGDAKRGIVYLPIGAPTFDRWGGDRHGANLYSNAVVALDARTGKFLWHFQTVHHDVWDLDLPAITLIEVRKNGRTIPAIAAMNKTSVLFMLDRVTGKPLFDVREVPVPTDTDIPGEQIWPTQPMSVTPPLAKVTYAAGDIAAVTPELKSFCEQLIKDKTVTPSSMFQPLRTDSAVASFPSSLGGIDWGGAAFDPGRGVYVANSNNLGALAQMVQQPDGSYAMKDGYLYFWNPQTHQPCNAPPWGNLSAVDVNSGKILWQVTLGISDDLPPGQQETGRFNIGNPMMTAGGLIFIGATDDSRFRAFDTATGKELWGTKLAGMANAGPISYLGKDGRQYVAVVGTGGNNGGIRATSDEISAFALPAEPGNKR
jgi:quinoprotein glucose dehydrogenase